MSVDVVISFDTTGSMYPCLSEVRRKVSTFITTLFDQVPNLRIGIITHGDYCDGNKVITSYPLTNNEHELTPFVLRAPQTDGGDNDECYEFVLKYAREKYDWQADTKILILIGDANPHEVGYNYNLSYSHKVNTFDWRIEAMSLVANGISIYPVQAMNRINSNAFYNKLASISNTPKLDLHQFSDIIPILTAVIFKQQSNELVQQYSEQVETSGQMNRSVAQIFDLLLGNKESSSKFTLTTDHKTDLVEVDPSRFQVLHVDHDIPINDFVRSTGAIFRIGRGFYELTKTELVQERKEVILRDKVTGDMWSGKEARELLGIPYGIRGKVKPHDIGYDVFIQSTSANRKLIGGTRFLYEAK